MDTTGWSFDTGSVLMTSKPGISDCLANDNTVWSSGTQSQDIARVPDGYWTRAESVKRSESVWKDASCTEESNIRGLDRWNSHPGTRDIRSQNAGAVDDQGSSLLSFENRRSSSSVARSTLREWSNSVDENKGAKITGGRWGDAREHNSSGWGSPDSSPVPNAGTESWVSSNTGHMQQSWNQSARGVWLDGQKCEMSGDKIGMQEESKVNHSGEKEVLLEVRRQPSWVSEPHSRSDGPHLHDQTFTSSLLQWSGHHEPIKESSSASNPSATSICVTSTSSAASVGIGPQSGNPNTASDCASTATANCGLPSSTGTWAQAAGRNIKPHVSSVTGNPLSSTSPKYSLRMASEDTIARAVNSRDGWGRTPVRQDTVWDVEMGATVSAAASKRTSIKGAIDAAIQHKIPIEGAAEGGEVVQQSSSRWNASTTGRHNNKLFSFNCSTIKKKC